MKEYTWIKTYVDAAFSREVNRMADQGWRVVHIDCWHESICGHQVTHANVFFERDKKEHTDGQDNTH